MKSIRKYKNKYLFVVVFQKPSHQFLIKILMGHENQLLNKKYHQNRLTQNQVLRKHIITNRPTEVCG